MEPRVSRGPGRVERVIAAALATEPDRAFTVQDLGERIYSGVNRMEKRHRVAIVRAMRSVAKRRAEIGVLEARSRGNPLVIFTRTSLSAASAAARQDAWYRFAKDFEPGGPWGLAVELAVATIDGDSGQVEGLTNRVKRFSFTYLANQHLFDAILGEGAIDNFF